MRVATIRRTGRSGGVGLPREAGETISLESIGRVLPTLARRQTVAQMADGRT
jgi:hypothetical protein